MFSCLGSQVAFIDSIFSQYDESNAAPLSGRERHHSAPSSHTRTRKRGPRSFQALYRRTRGCRAPPGPTFGPVSLHDFHCFTSLGTACSPSNLSHLNSQESTSTNFSPNSRHTSCQNIITPQRVTCISLNIRSLLKHNAELYVFTQQHAPDIILLQETWLNSSIKSMHIPGYDCVSRLDRPNRIGGGVCVYARNSLKILVHLSDSDVAERSWHILHTDLGSILLVNFFRAPDAGEEPIASLIAEPHNYSQGCIHTILVGDFNIHHKSWLRFSNGGTALGQQLHDICQDHGLSQTVRHPTRGQYLLDLLLCDISVSVSCLPMIADHNAVKFTFVINSSVSNTPAMRSGWVFKRARWNLLRHALRLHDWEYLSHVHLDLAVSRFTQDILNDALAHIPCRSFPVESSSHPWVDHDCKRAIELKHLYENTDSYNFHRDQCSDLLAAKYRAYIERTKLELASLKKGSKKWWKLIHSLMHRRKAVSSIPALKHDDQWVVESPDKASLFAVSWQDKNTLPPATHYSYDDRVFSTALDDVDINLHYGLHVLRSLNEHKSTGPDHLPAKLIKACATVLIVPLMVLARRILAEGYWPQPWRHHNLCPLYKRKAVHDPNNYRGIHLTCILAKCCERIIGAPLLHYFDSINAFGSHQWAYRKHHSYKDLITLLICSWIHSICSGECIGCYLGDISGAFDRVFRPYLLDKLKRLGIGKKFHNFLASFLDQRTAQVVVEGSFSASFPLVNQVFQGTVLGPPLWNCFFSGIVESCMPTRSTGKAFADDFNCFKCFDRAASHSAIMRQLHHCRDDVHEWGRRHRICFDSTKEGFCIIHPRSGSGSTFRLLGLMIDCALDMQEAVSATLSRARPKLQALMRSRQFFDISAIIMQYKTHILSIVESNTGGIYHATTTTLKPLDRIQTTFVHGLNLEVSEAFLRYNLAPLCLRRDIAMMGFLHKCSCKCTHPDIMRLFPVRGERELWNILDYVRQIDHASLATRSIFQLTYVYNNLPLEIRQINGISAFQSRLTDVARNLCQRNHDQWQTFLSARHWNSQNIPSWIELFE